MSGDALQFDPATHTYTAGGVVVPSVTQILSDVGFIDSTRFTDEARDRGQKVAKAVALDTIGRLRMDTLDETLRPYVNAARAFRDAMQFKAIFVEHPVWSRGWNYAGTLDAFGDATTGRMLIDWKTGSPAPWHSLQTYAYAMAIGGVNSTIRASVILNDNGTYRYIEHRDTATDERMWKAALDVYHWKRRNVQ